MIELETYLLFVSAAIVGLSAILATSSLAFTIVKLLGACYLIWLGIQAIAGVSQRPSKQMLISEELSAKTIFMQGFLCDLLNPKVAIFYLAFLPQFVDPNGGNHFIQLVLLGITVNTCGLLVDLIVVFFSTRVAHTFRENNRLTCWLNRIMGAVFIALGIRLARERL